MAACILEHRNPWIFGTVTKGTNTIIINLSEFTSISKCCSNNTAVDSMLRTRNVVGSPQIQDSCADGRGIGGGVFHPVAANAILYSADLRPVTRFFQGAVADMRTSQASYIGTLCSMV